MKGNDIKVRLTANNAVIITDRRDTTVIIQESDWPELKETIDALLPPAGRGEIKDEVERLWSLAPRTSRARSSKKQLYDKWKLNRTLSPGIDDVEASLKLWVQSRPWKEGYAEGIHRWVQNRRWEVEPELAEQPKRSGFTSADVGI